MVDKVNTDIYTIGHYGIFRSPLMGQILVQIVAIQSDGLEIKYLHTLPRNEKTLFSVYNQPISFIRNAQIPKQFIYLGADKDIGLQTVDLLYG